MKCNLCGNYPCICPTTPENWEIKYEPELRAIGNVWAILITIVSGAIFILMWIGVVLTAIEAPPVAIGFGVVFLIFWYLDRKGRRLE